MRRAAVGPAMISQLASALPPFEDKAVIAYLVETNCVRITNVFYGGRDFEALYRNVDPAD